MVARPDYGQAGARTQLPSQRAGAGPLQPLASDPGVRVGSTHAAEATASLLLNQ